MLQKREQAPKCGSNEEEKKTVKRTDMKERLQVKNIVLDIHDYMKRKQI
jgi:predicted nucleic-acid-binding Zn-ribbon protein